MLFLYVVDDIINMPLGEGKEHKCPNLDWMVNKRKGKSKFVQRLDEAVQKARNHEEWRMEYMTLLMRDNKMREEGRVEGRIEGSAKEIVEMGLEFGLSESEILSRLQKKLNIKLGKARELFGKYKNEERL